MPGDDVSGLWTGYHNALGLKKSTPPGTREQSVSTGGSLLRVYFVVVVRVMCVAQTIRSDAKSVGIRANMQDELYSHSANIY